MTHQQIARTRGAKSGDGQLTVAEYLTDWLNGRRSLRPSTRVAYEIHLRRFLVPHLGDIPLASLCRRDVEAMYTRLLDADDPGDRLTPATAHRLHATLMSALNAAVRRRQLEHNPAALVDLPRVPRVEMSIWSAGELNQFLNSIRADSLYPLLALMAVTGLRRGEAVGLRWIDVDLTRAQLRIEQQIVSVAGEPHVGPPKSSRGRRTIALPQTLVHLLQNHRDEQRQQLPHPMPVDNSLVFTATDGSPLNPNFVSRRFDRLVIETSLPRIRLHDLRHTSASLGLASGESLVEVSRRLGHSTITITADVYSHVSPITAHQSANRLSDLIASTSRTLEH